MTRTEDAALHLAEVKNFMAGKQIREQRRITRDLAARLNPIHLTSAIASVLPHVAKDGDNHLVGMIFTSESLLLVASSGWTSIVTRTPDLDGARVTGDVVADSVIITPQLAKQLMGFAGLTPKESYDPQLEVEVTGTGPNLKLRATDRTGLFEGKSITLPVMEPTKELARTTQALESLAAHDTMPARTHGLETAPLAAFVASAKPWGGEFDLESVTPTTWRVRCDAVWYGLITTGASTDEAKTALATRRTRHRSEWSGRLSGIGQELAKGLAPQ